MGRHSVLAAVDLGSNSFHLEIARVINDQLYPLDHLREPVRLAAGLSAEKTLDGQTQERALACLTRFGERLREFSNGAVRAVGTSTLRVAKNAPQFLHRAEEALGFPIEVVAGREEARLIYLGVAHSLPSGNEPKLVVDIGGGSTELIVGTNTQPEKLESLHMGCVTYTQRYFPDGKITKESLAAAELAARNELEAVASKFSSKWWSEAIGSSGTARTCGNILQQRNWSDGGITQEGMLALRTHLIKAAGASQLGKLGLRPDRMQALPGGFAILHAVMTELGITRMNTSQFAMRDGILHDLLGRCQDYDVRDVTVGSFMQRYQVDQAQAGRVEAFAQTLLQGLNEGARDWDSIRRMVGWAARLHEIGLFIAHGGHHKHAAYILEKADMPGFSNDERTFLSRLALAHRGSLKKMQGKLDDEAVWKPTLALRLAALFHRSRNECSARDLSMCASGTRVELRLPDQWLELHPLTAAALKAEITEWHQLGIQLKLVRV